MSYIVQSVTILVVWVVSLGCASFVQAQVVGNKSGDAVFSGPQIGEALPGFKITSLTGDSEGQEFDPVMDAKDQAITLVFLHELTRPGFGLMRAVTQFAAGRKSKGMNVAVVFLTDDATATMKWSKNVQGMFKEDVKYGVSMEGKEGPGSYGLNRNVIATVLVGKQGRVTGNFALVQPQLQVDGPKILEAIATISGGGKVPSMAELEPKYAGRSRMDRGRQQNDAARRSGNNQPDARLSALLRRVIDKQATDAAVRDAATRVEEYVARSETAEKELTRIVTTIVNSDRFENYGTPEAQKVLKKWFQKYGADRNSKREQTKADSETRSEKE